VFECAALALRFACDADLAAVVDEFVGELYPAVFGDDLFEVLLDFDGLGVGGELEAAREAKDVRVDDDAGGDAVPGAKDDVRGLARDAGELRHLVDGFGNFAVEFVHEDTRGGNDVLCFGTEEARALDDLLDGRRVGFRERFGGREEPEEFGRRLVDADVCGLRGEDGGDGQLERVAVVERADDVGVGLAECVEDGGDAFGREGTFSFAGFCFGRDRLACGDLFCAGGWNAFDGCGAFGGGELLRWGKLFRGALLCGFGGHGKTLTQRKKRYSFAHTIIGATMHLNN